MRIIKQAMKLPEKNIVCGYCKSELAYDDRDVRVIHAEWYEELYIICPVCGRKIVLKHSNDGC